MSKDVSPPVTRDGYTYASVHDGRQYLGRIVESGGTWAPDSRFTAVVGNARWDSYDEAKAALEARRG